jgi:hypothetical protein
MSTNTIMLSGETLAEMRLLLADDLPEKSKTPMADPLVRQRPRVAYRRPVLAIPVRPDGGPDWENRMAGRTTDIGLEGIGLEFQRSLNLQTLGLVLSLAADSGPGCLGVDVGNSHDSDRDICHVGGQFTGFANEILKPENLTPRLNPRRWQFELAYPEAILDQWAQVGILEPVLWDRVQLCPRCHGLPTFRRGCSACGSIHVKNDRLIHHFACAHVGLVAEFEGRHAASRQAAAPGDLVCPKCRTRRLIIGSDYEYMMGPYRCRDCQWTGTELEQVAQCLRCHLRFPVGQSYEQELKGYRAHRLDPLALLPSLGSALSLSDGPAADRCPALCAH